MTVVEDRMYIKAVAAELNREPHTLRVWGYHNRLPKDLQPHRDEKGWRYWTKEQVAGLKQWMIDEDMRPGKAFRKQLASRRK